MWILSLTHLQTPVLIAALFLAASNPACAVTLTDGPKVESSASTATITWSTDVACGTRLSYGTVADALTQKAEGEVTGNHIITLSELHPGTTYYYVVGSARARLGTGSFTTTGKGAAEPKASIQESKKTATAARAPPPDVTLKKAPPTRSTWASLDSLPDHFARHGGDFSAPSKEDYAAQAWFFLQRARQEGLPMKWDEEGETLRVWDPARRIFAAYNRSGKTRTFFKPGNPDYWNKQPGKAIRPTDLSF